ncbi:intraflagellar transport protein 57 homolog [Phlebotomus argentipes]|uniref:intraflagellar transport protein 57 homolog n=1 Tax=Phlebotomus argentipes TaxID=94469 RepID=UPI0028934CA3|nr:intraflagellar transport protein 57 homolog [Phlebotomus argentipes]
MSQSDFSGVLEREQTGSGQVGTFQVEDLMDKLKLLNCDRLLVKELKLKPPNRMYFAKSTNPGEQFFMFTSICAWLMRKLGHQFDQPQEFDDPSATIAKIIRILQEMDISTDFPSNKLIQGAGAICVYILDSLATQALKVAKVNLKRPETVQEEDTVTEMIENDSEIILEKVEEEQNALMAASDDSDEENSLLNLNLSGSGQKNRQQEQGFHLKNYRQDSIAATESWRLELERVMPQLKIVVKSDPRDWRAHLEQMKTFRSTIDQASSDTDSQLKKLQTGIGHVMEKIESREKHLNAELQPLIAQYRTLSVELKQLSSAIAAIDAEKSTKERELAGILGEIETVKMQMEQRGTSMTTDGSPLIAIKKAIVKIREEILQMDLKIGVLDHSLTQEIINHNAQIAELAPMTAILH